MPLDAYCVCRSIARDLRNILVGFWCEQNVLYPPIFRSLPGIHGCLSVVKANKKTHPAHHTHAHIIDLPKQSSNVFHRCSSVCAVHSLAMFFSTDSIGAMLNKRTQTMCTPHSSRRRGSESKKLLFPSSRGFASRNVPRRRRTLLPLDAHSGSRLLSLTAMLNSISIIILWANLFSFCTCLTPADCFSWIMVASFVICRADDDGPLNVRMVVFVEMAIKTFDQIFVSVFVVNGKCVRFSCSLKAKVAEWH